MDLKLAENIRTLRKDRKLTQEQLAEVLGVTTGAVYKWESGLSIPELPMLMEKYYRGSGAKGQAGFGLGLYLTRSYMEKQGGGAEVYNDNGFVVELYLRKV